MGAAEKIQEIEAEMARTQKVSGVALLLKIDLLKTQLAFSIYTQPSPPPFDLKSPFMALRIKQPSTM